MCIQAVHGRTALDLASAGNHIKVIEALLVSGDAIMVSCVSPIRQTSFIWYGIAPLTFSVDDHRSTMPGRAPITRSDVCNRVAPLCACPRKRSVCLFPYSMQPCCAVMCMSPQAFRLLVSIFYVSNRHISIRLQPCVRSMLCLTML